jgi:hypothetical protein
VGLSLLIDYVLLFDLEAQQASKMPIYDIINDDIRSGYPKLPLKAKGYWQLSAYG